MKRSSAGGWVVYGLGIIYFFLPLVGTGVFSLRARANQLSLDAYASVLADSRFRTTFTFSLEMAALTVVASVVLVLPAAFWVHLRMPRVRPLLELTTLLPFVIPGIVLVFGLIKTYSRPPIALVVSPGLLVAGYVVLSLPYVYRAIDTGLRSIDVRTLTEAALSLGASWPAVVVRVIVPNLGGALLTGALLTFALVMGELTLAQYLGWPAFGPYMALVGANRAYEPAALAIISFALTWGAMAILLIFSQRQSGRQLVGPR
jgi:putative spermidine/putrescine transport system permease protein